MIQVKKLKFSSARTLLGLTLIAGLAACGGGGGGSTAQQNPTPTVTPGNLVTSVATPTYATGSEELAAFNLLNAERQRCGFGLLAQNTKLDAAARAHADWNLINNLFLHEEDGTVSPNGFTGASPRARAIYQGYGTSGAWWGEVMASSGTSSKNGWGAYGTRFLLNAPFHLIYMVKGYRDTGVSIRSNSDAGASVNNSFLMMEFGAVGSDGLQDVASDAVVTYPCEGSTGVSNKLINETPNPVPGRDLSTSPLGTSILISVRQGQSLSITSATLVEKVSGNSVTLRPTVGGVNGVADTIENAYGSSTAYIAADAPMLANTAYTMTIVGSNNGTAFTKSFTFTTGSGF